jgi:exopolysaccharide biosynthesis polyprenyl glycosylphosphotransferase
MLSGSKLEFAPNAISQAALPVGQPAPTQAPPPPRSHPSSKETSSLLPNSAFYAADRLYASKAVAIGLYALALGAIVLFCALEPAWTTKQMVTYTIFACSILTLVGAAIWKVVLSLPSVQKALKENVLIVGDKADILAFEALLPARLPFRTVGAYTTDSGNINSDRIPVLGELPADYLLAPAAVDRLLLVSRTIDVVEQQNLQEKLAAFSCPITACILPLAGSFTSAGNVLPGCTLVPLEAAVSSPKGRFWKRVFDISASSAVLIGLFPLLVVSALMVKFTSDGPVLFRQPRWGRDGRIFHIYKFRSMYVNQCDNGRDNVVQARRDDDRITKIGRILRQTSIDELPQLLNVLKGEMSLIGPRPHAVGHNLQYTPIVQGYLARHRMKPGLSGLAQVNGFRGETPSTEVMQARIDKDNEYVTNWTIGQDLTITLKTVGLVLSRKNAF